MVEILLVIFIGIVTTCGGCNHINKEPDGEVDDRGEEEEGEANPDLPECGRLHIVESKTEKRRNIYLLY